MGWKACFLPEHLTFSASVWLPFLHQFLNMEAPQAWALTSSFHFICSHSLWVCVATQMSEPPRRSSLPNSRARLHTPSGQHHSSVP
jgi:hypothetical protein